MAFNVQCQKRSREGQDDTDASLVVYLCDCSAALTQLARAFASSHPTELQIADEFHEAVQAVVRKRTLANLSDNHTHSQVTEDLAAQGAKALGAEHCLHAAWIRRCSSAQEVLPPRPFEVLHVHKQKRIAEEAHDSQDTDVMGHDSLSGDDELFPAGGTSEADDSKALLQGEPSQATTYRTDSQATEVDTPTEREKCSRIWQQRRAFRQEVLSSAAAQTALPTADARVQPAVQPQQVKGYSTYAVVRSGTAASATRNKWLTEQLDAIAAWYSEAPEVSEDQFRSRQFGMLSSIFSGFHEMEATSSEVMDAVMAVKGLPGVNKTATEVHDWLAGGATGVMPRLQRLRSSPLRQDLKDLQQVWGVGLKNAQRLRSIGIRRAAELQKLVFCPVPACDLPAALPRDIVARLQQANSFAQRGHALGLSLPAITSLPFTDDIQRRIPRAEIESLFCGLQSVLRAMYPAAIAQVCGSFRRGAASSGDIDVLITHPDGGLLDLRPVLQVLSVCGSLVAHLASPDLPTVFGSFSRSTVQKVNPEVDADLGRKQQYMGMGVDKAERTACMAQVMVLLLKAVHGSSAPAHQAKSQALKMLPWLTVAAPIENAAHAEAADAKRQVNAATVAAVASLAIPRMVLTSCNVCIPHEEDTKSGAGHSLYASPAASEDCDDHPGTAARGPANGDPSAIPVSLAKAVGLHAALQASKHMDADTKQRVVRFLPILWHIESFLGHWGPARRVDIKTYVAAAYPFAVLYFTGSAYFNRSMRYYADNTGLTLSDTGIARVAARDKRRGVRQAQAKERHLRTERDIFDFMGIPWKEPWERNCLPVDATSLAAQQGGVEAVAAAGSSSGGGGGKAYSGAAPASISPAQLLRDERCVKLMTAILKDNR